MPRPWQETIHPWPELSNDQTCRCVVTDVSKSRDPHGIRVGLRYLDEPHRGRTHDILLSLPIRPSGLASEFFAACGLTAAVGAALSPPKAIGSIVTVRVAQTPEGHWSPIWFESVKNKEQNDA